MLDQGLEPDLLSDVQKYLEDLIGSGLRHRFITLLKVLHSGKDLFFSVPPDDMLAFPFFCFPSIVMAKIYLCFCLVWLKKIYCGDGLIVAGICCILS